MERKEIYEKMEVIFKEVFELENISLNDQICSDDIEAWDSLSNVQLVSAIQKEFSIRVKAREIVSWKNVGEMVDSIQAKLNEK